MEDLELKKKVLDEILEHLSDSQAQDFASMLSGSKVSEAMEGDPAVATLEKVEIDKPEEEGDSKVDEKIAQQGDVEAKEYSDDEEMSDEELEELLKSHLK